MTVETLDLSAALDGGEVRARLKGVTDAGAIELSGRARLLAPLEGSQLQAELQNLDLARLIPRAELEGVVSGDIAASAEGRSWTATGTLTGSSLAQGPWSTEAVRATLAASGEGMDLEAVERGSKRATIASGR
ncbi:MAG: hypothetical protein HC923_09090 [Myxococcales bacterium]|nr:hypothetical protein [Myxococcales bacterium]